MRFEERRIHLARRPHGKSAQHQVAPRNSLECPEIRAASLCRLLKAAQCLIETLAGMALPVVPAVPDQIFRLWYIQPIAKLGVVADPASEFLKGFFDLSHRYSNRVPRNGNSVPCFTDHGCIVYAAATA